MIASVSSAARESLLLLRASSRPTASACSGRVANCQPPAIRSNCRPLPRSVRAICKSRRAASTAISSSASARARSARETGSPATKSRHSRAARVVARVGGASESIITPEIKWIFLFPVPCSLFPFWCQPDRAAGLLLLRAHTALAQQLQQGQKRQDDVVTGAGKGKESLERQSLRMRSDLARDLGHLQAQAQPAARRDRCDGLLFHACLGQQALQRLHELLGRRLPLRHRQDVIVRVFQRAAEKDLTAHLL